MASLDFPSSPTNGQTYSSAGVTWTYDSTYTVWNITSSGPVGYSGSQGYTGSQGVIGYTGSKGDLGYTGSKGTDGVIGYNGSVGYTGSSGYTGSKGDLGYTGSAGAVSADTQIIFNNSGALVGNASLTFAYSSNTMNVNGAINATSHSVGSNFIANTTQVTLASTVKLSANGTVGSNGKYLSSNGSTPSWIQIPAFNQVSNSAPTTPTPISGDRWYDSDSGIQYTYLTGVSGSQWVETSTTGAASTVYNKSTFTATASQTTFSVTYTVGYIDIWVNGVKLTTGNYTATNGTSVVLGVGCAVNDIVEIIGWSVWTITNTNIGIGSGTSLALGGATIGANALAVTGTAAISGLLTAAGGVSSTLTTDATSSTTGSIITAGGISCQKALFVGTTSRLVGNVRADGLVGIGKTPASLLDMEQTQNTTSKMHFTNASTGAAGIAELRLSNSNSNTQMFLTSTGYTPAYNIRADGAYIGAGGAGGLTVSTTAAQPIYFGINYVEKMRLDASGNLLVGTTSAITKLTVSGKGSFSTGVAVGTVSGSQAAYESDYQQAAILQYNFLPGYAAAIFAEVQTSTSSDHWFGITGNYGSYGSATMVLQACNQITSGTSGNFITSDASGILTFGQIIGGASAYSSNATKTEFMRLDGSGSLLVGTTTSSGGYHYFTRTVADYAMRIENKHASTPYGLSLFFSAASPNNTSQYFLACTDSTTARALIFANGNLQNQNNSYGGISDAKVKQDIIPASGQWDDVKALAGMAKKYHLKSDPDGHLHLGLVAQDVLTVSPGLVVSTPDMELVVDEKTGEETRVPTGTETLGINYSILYLKAVLALGEAQGRIETLEARLDAAGIK